MRSLIVAFAIMFTGCSTCVMGTGVIYRNESKLIDQVQPWSPAEKAGIVVGSTLIAHEDGHLVIADPNGKITTYDLPLVCVKKKKFEMMAIW